MKILVKHLFLTFFILFILSIVLGAYHSPYLPNEVPSHFNTQGQAEGNMPKSSFLLTYYTFISFIFILFSSIVCFMNKIPLRLINLPNKEIWFSEKNRETTIEYLNKAILSMGIATYIMLLDLYNQIFQVGLGQASGLTHSMASLSIYISVIIVWSLFVIRKFSVVPK